MWRDYTLFLRKSNILILHIIYKKIRIHGHILSWNTNHYLERWIHVYIMIPYKWSSENINKLSNEIHSFNLNDNMLIKNNIDDVSLIKIIKTSLWANFYNYIYSKGLMKYGS